MNSGRQDVILGWVRPPFLRFRPSLETPIPSNQNAFSNHVQIGQREHGKGTRGVLGQAAIAHLGEAPQLLDDAKRMFAASPGPKACAVDHALGFGQRFASSAAPVDTVADAGLLAVFAVPFGPVGLVTVNLLFFAVNQLVDATDVSFIGVLSSYSDEPGHAARR